MLARLFPERFNNDYRGYRLALWCFGLLVLIKMGIGVNSIFNGYFVASTADGIPLETFTAISAQTVVSLFALMGFYHFMTGLLCVVVLLRYRTMLPLMFVLLIMERLGRTAILLVLPIAKTTAAKGAVVGLVMLALMLSGLVLSLMNKNDTP